MQLINRQNKKRIAAIFLLWLMAFCHFSIITHFSSQPATDSAMTSGNLLDKILEIFLGDKMNEMDAEAHEIIHNILRKTAHFTNFLILGFIYIMFAETYQGKLYVNSMKAVLICGLTAAMLDETHQYFVPGRSAEITDVCIDFSGFFAGCILYCGLKKGFK